MRYLLILSLAFTLYACCKSDKNGNKEIPNCVQEIIDDPELSMDLKTVKVQEVNNEPHYWLNTDHTHFDGVEYIVNSSCDTICFFCGECFPPECIEEYDQDWLVIWEK